MDWQAVIADILAVLPEILALPVVTGGGFLAIITSIPAMWSVLVKLKKLELDSETLLKAVQMIPVMSAAIQKAQESGDTSDLEALFGKPKAQPSA